MMQTTVDGRTIEGRPLAWSDSQILLLGRDGVLHDFDPAAAKDSRRSADRFASYTAAEMAARFRESTPKTFETTTTTHFVIVRPRDAKTDWAGTLESLYNGFTQYASVRGIAVSPPATPLAAVIFHSADDYRSHAAASGHPVSSNTLGHYDPQTNRIYLFEAPGSDSSVTASTVVHEATHQTAYNVGVHQRFAEQSRWVVEGLAMMFEAPGVWNSATLHDREDRINRERLVEFRRTAESRPADWIVRLVISDRDFDSDALRAYAEAWTLTFYLCETRPQDYAAYLARTARRELFSKYTPLERASDFSASFGDDWTQLGAQLDRFVKELP